MECTARKQKKANEKLYKGKWQANGNYYGSKDAAGYSRRKRL
jgi:hypothetical protein